VQGGMAEVPMGGGAAEPVVSMTAAVQALGPQPRQCSLPGCPVTEEKSAGVLLLACPCHAAHYCTGDHQRLAWREHRRVCPKAAAAKEQRAKANGAEVKAG
jgi:hypothetical protein